MHGATETIDDLRKGSLHLNCECIELRSGDQSRVFKGPGYIRLDDLEFSVTLFVEGTPAMQQARPPLFAGGVSPGVLLPKEHYWSMAATDTRGRRWSAERIALPSTEGSGHTSGYTLSGSCRELTMTNDASKTYHARRIGIEMRCFDCIAFPRNACSRTTVVLDGQTRQESTNFNLAKSSFLGFELEIAEEDGDTRLRMTTGAPMLHPHVESRVSEALLFVLGTDINWSVIERTDEGSIRLTLRPRSKPHKPRFSGSPIAFNTISHADAVWNMFELYLSYVLQDTVSPYHPLSAQVSAVVLADEASVEAQALSVAVAVESVLNLFYRDVGRPAQSVLDAVKELQAYINEWHGMSELKTRALGSVGQMKSVRPGDRLRDLIERRVVADKNVSAWTRLRNSVAHGDWSGVADLQTFIDRTEDVLVLFNQLIFHLIGYKGKYTDWGAHGWPIIQYPP